MATAQRHAPPDRTAPNRSALDRAALDRAALGRAALATDDGSPHPGQAGELRRFSRAEYDRLVELGFLEGERVELLHGMVVRMSAQSEDHVHAVTELQWFLSRALPPQVRVRGAAPYAASEDSEPEPDMAVVDHVKGRRGGHPQDAHLLVEVSLSSLRIDRDVKAAIYAANGVPEYWIVNLVERCVEVYSEPRGGRYRRVETLPEDAVRAVPGFPDVQVPFAELFLPEDEAE